MPQPTHGTPTYFAPSRRRAGARWLTALIAGVIAIPAIAAHTAARGRTWANPVDIDYRYNL
ncbi:MAG TPA: hypothetical protein VNE18_13255 [Rhodanobacter sp.]|nr:hypothetical protein [Rhodanobacter sp.]